MTAYAFLDDHLLEARLTFLQALVIIPAREFLSFVLGETYNPNTHATLLRDCCNRALAKKNDEWQHYILEACRCYLLKAQTNRDSESDRYLGAIATIAACFNEKKMFANVVKNLHEGLEIQYSEELGRIIGLQYHDFARDE